MSAWKRNLIVLSSVVTMMACTADELTGPDFDPRNVAGRGNIVVIQTGGDELDEVVVHGCQYGGEYPNCNSAPDESSEPSGGSDGPTGTSGEGSTGTGDGSVDIDFESCDPRKSGCHQPLTDSDKALVNGADQYFKADPPDPFCQALYDKFRTIRSENGIFRGNPAMSTGHGGARYGNTFHVDGQFFDRAASDPTTIAARDIAVMMLHEAAHILGKKHENAPNDPNYKYTKYPFTLLNYREKSGCVAYP